MSTSKKAERVAIVFGGSGFVGRHLIRRLEGMPYKRIICADIKKPPAPFELAEYIECDVRKQIIGVRFFSMRLLDKHLLDYQNRHY